MSNIFKVSLIPTIFIYLFLVSFFVFPNYSYAHNPPPDADGNCPAEHSPLGSVCQDDDITTGPITGTSSEGPSSNALPGIGTIDPGSIPFFEDVGGLVSSLLNIIYLLAVVFFLIQVAIGGIAWINAGGDPKNLESARGRITNAVIGLVIVVAAFAITLIVTTVLGVNIFGGEIDIVP